MGEGIWVGKDKKSGADGKYDFRAIDDVVAYLQPMLAKHGITVVQRVVHHERENYSSRGGGSMVSVRLLVEHQFTSAEDGSFVICTTLGEASDTSDKAS